MRRDKVTEGFRRYATPHYLNYWKFTSYQPSPPLPLANLRLETKIRMRSVHSLPKFIRKGMFEAFKAVRLVSDSPVGTEVCDQIVVIVLVDAKKGSDLAILLAGCSSEFDQRIGDIEGNQPESR